ncbi:MAG: hypothetical protein IJT32_06655, partial [Lachnospiraceae bacterium]|nr:hypothetical protein [Lachnospiraceae bacterium]
MTAVKKEAINLIEGMPDEQVMFIIRFIKDKRWVISQPKTKKTKEQKALDNLEKYFGRIEETIEIKADLEKA